MRNATLCVHNCTALTIGYQEEGPLTELLKRIGRLRKPPPGEFFFFSSWLAMELTMEFETFSSKGG